MLELFQLINDINQAASAVQDAIGTVNRTISIVHTIIAAVAVAAGVVQAFFGFKWFMFTLPVNAFLAGGLVGALLGALIGGGSVPLAIAFGVVLGAAGVIFVRKAFRLAIFIGASIPTALVSILAFAAFMHVLNIGQNLGIISRQDFISVEANAVAILLMGIHLAIIIGTLAVIFLKPVIISQTAFSSAGLIAGNIGVLLGAGTVGLHILIGLLCGIGGFVYQWKPNKGGVVYLYGHSLEPEEIRKHTLIAKTMIICMFLLRITVGTYWILSRRIYYSLSDAVWFIMVELMILGVMIFAYLIKFKDSKKIIFKIGICALFALVILNSASWGARLAVYLNLVTTVLLLTLFDFSFVACISIIASTIDKLKNRIVMWVCISFIALSIFGHVIMPITISTSISSAIAFTVFLVVIYSKKTTPLQSQYTTFNNEPVMANITQDIISQPMPEYVSQEKPRARFCTKCGAQVKNNGAAFCGKCGGKL